MHKISIIIGTRPEAIKLVPLILALKKSANLKVEVCSTGQHKEMLKQVFDLFKITPDYELNIMTHNQNLSDLTALLLTKLNEYLEISKPDFLICQGDTTTAFVSALAAFYQKIPVGHVEAGLRTSNKYSPYPEEINRQLISRIADLHFAPTKNASNELIKENISTDQIFITGNTVIDALKLVQHKITENEVEISQDIKSIFENKKYILITGHRRENFGKGFQNICAAIKTVASKFSDIQFIYPVHLNPNVKSVVEKELGNTSNIHLIAPLDYTNFIYALSNAFIVLTDSGGVQEEAPSFKKPVLVMRENSERMEGVEAGVVKLVGTEVNSIVNGISELLLNENTYLSMTYSENPYGDGKASDKIVQILENYFTEK